jgi:hypothetical protein
MQLIIEILIGVIWATGFVLFVGQIKNFAKEKFIFSIGLVVTALVYVGFGFFAESNNWKIIEFAGMLIYSGFAWLGFKKSSWFLVFGWMFHIIWDAVLHGISTPFVPHWYIGFCIGFDLAVASFIAFKEIKK